MHCDDHAAVHKVSLVSCHMLGNAVFQVRSQHVPYAAAQLWEKFRPGQTPPSSLGASRDYNVDMVPKFIMANGNLVKVSAARCTIATHHP